MNTTARLLGVLALATCAAGAHADLIELKNGQKYSGNMVRQGDVMTITTDDGKTITARPDDIKGVTLTSSITPDEAAKAEWTRVAQQVKTSESLQAIIDLHKKFLDKFPDAAQSKEVRSSMEVYTKLSENEGVKFRGRWVPKAQIDVILKQWTEAAKPAVDMYKVGRMKEALDAIKPVIAADAQNPDALTLAGLAAYRLNTLPASKTYFTTLAAVDPTSVLAENNLAVIAFQQNQQAEGLAHYIKALQIMPDNRLLLDNVAEAMNTYASSLKSGDKNTPIFASLQKLYDPAEAHMETEMAKKGMSRWGGTWVTKDQKDALAKNEIALKYKMTTLEAQYKSTADAVAAIDSKLSQAKSDYENTVVLIANIDAQSAASGTSTRMVDIGALQAQRNQLAMHANQLTQYQTTLQNQRAQTMSSAPDFFAQANKLKADLAAAGGKSFTGVQHIMDLGDAENPPPPAPVKLAARGDDAPANAPAGDAYPTAAQTPPQPLSLAPAGVALTTSVPQRPYGVSVQSTPDGSSITVFRNGGSQTTDMPGQRVVGAGISPGGVTIKTK